MKFQSRKPDLQINNMYFILLYHISFIFLHLSNLNALDVWYKLSLLFYSTFPANASVAL